MSDMPPASPRGPVSTNPGFSNTGFSNPAQAAVPPPAAAARRRRRPRTRWRAAFFALAAVAIVGGVGWALLGNRVFVVRSVTVTGTHLLAQAQIVAAADVKLGTPLMSVDDGAVSRRVEAIPQVASASVTEDWPDRLVIAVTERSPAVAVRMANGSYDLVDPTGVIVRNTKARPAGLPVFVTSLPGSALRGNPDVAAVAQVLAELQPWLSRQVADVTAATAPAGPEQVTLTLRDGKAVQWGSPGDAAQKNRELSVLLPEKVSDIDVSAPGSVVTK